jgi:multidrug efflux pump subunit AcrB
LPGVETIAAEHAIAAELPKSQSRGHADYFSRDVLATLPLSEVDNYAENMLAEEISMVNGVAQVNVFGSQQYAVRIQVDPNKLAAYGLGIDQVEQAVEREM